MQQLHQHDLEDRDNYNFISPLDYRYLRPDDPGGKRVRAYLAEEAYVAYLTKVEIALARALAQLGICSWDVAHDIQRGAAEVTAADVYAEESVTRHNIRALVNCIQRRVGEDSRPFVHLFVTSADIMDTASALRLKDFSRNVLLPDLIDLELQLIEIAQREADTIQIGRTHGRFAEPTTFGFAIALYIDRLGARIVKVVDAVRNLRGKVSGAVGAYNSMSVVSPEAPDRLESLILSELGLASTNRTISSQIVQPEFIADLAYASVSTFSVLANLADDIRHLHRSEIAEVEEFYRESEVGSSTMPHKRNPRSFENVKSLWKEFAPRVITVLMDQISEHQRDLTNSASSRFTSEIFAALDYSATRLTSALSSLKVNRDRMKENFSKSAGEIIAEPLYLALALIGVPDAYEQARMLVRRAREMNEVPLELAKRDPSLARYLEKLSEGQMRILEDPSHYTGFAPIAARETAARWTGEMRDLKGILADDNQWIPTV